MCSESISKNLGPYNSDGAQYTYLLYTGGQSWCSLISTEKLQGIDLDEENKLASSIVEERDDEDDDDKTSAGIANTTLSAMEKLFENIFSNIEITINNLSIFLESPSSQTSLEVSLAYAKVTNDKDGSRVIKFRDVSLFVCVMWGQVGNDLSRYLQSWQLQIPHMYKIMRM